MKTPNFFAGAGLDRASQRRGDTDWVAAQRDAATARLIPVWQSRNLFAELDPPRGAFLPAKNGTELLADADEAVLLGLGDDAAAFWALDVSHMETPETHPDLAGQGAFADIRAHGPLLDRQDGALLAYARGILTWHRRHRFCGVCGAATASREAGHQRACSNPDCAVVHFPRTDPAVIMLVTCGDQCLLGRQEVWPAGMYSTLAGFVEPGESLEEAVAREVHEEAGLRVGPVHYHSSQPWPFPASIMLGFHAEAEDMDLAVNTDELEDARWFSRDFIRNHPPDDEFRSPRADSIARRLIEDWLAGD